MTVQSLLDGLGPEIEDPEEESFLLFSANLPSQNLGFVDQKATSIDLSIAGIDLTIRQSPTILSSTRGGGTTGAVVWKVTPLFASWIVSATNPFHAHSVFTPASSVLELGSGISGIIGLCLGPRVHSYTLTDQEYVLKLLRQNLEENRDAASGAGASRGRKSAARAKRGTQIAVAAEQVSNIRAMPLDWETDEVANVAGKGESFDAVIACDCIYNDALIAPLVQTCVDACRLRRSHGAGGADEAEPTVCIIAQQLRSDEVFEGWLKEFHRSFRVWRIPDEMLIDGIKENSGFVVHVGILRDG